MKLAIMSDFHLGFAGRTAMASDSYGNAGQALEIALEEKADAIVIAGDIFDSAVPAQEALFEAFRLFSVVRKGKSAVRITVRGREGSEQEKKFAGLPVIAIHGTHEFRGKDYKNVIELMDSAGFLIHIHAAVALIEKGSERLAVHGMGGVPEKKALDALRLWKPEPLRGCTNILLLHQSIKEYLPFEDEMVATIALSDLPQGFDLIIDGHLHWCSEEKLPQGRLAMPGSTIITQMKRLESEKQKGIYLFDSSTGKLDFRPLPRQRRLFYHRTVFDGASAQEVLEKVVECIEADLGQPLQLEPLIRLKLAGTLAKGVGSQDVELGSLNEKFAGRAILSMECDFGSPSFTKKIAELRELQKSRRGIASMGLEVLERNLAETSFGNAFDARRVFELLADDRVEDAMRIISESRRKPLEGGVNH